MNSHISITWINNINRFFKLFKKNKIKEINSDIIIQNTDNNIYEMDEDKFSKAEDLDNNYIHDF